MVCAIRIVMKPLYFTSHIDKLSYLNTFYIEVPAIIVTEIGGIGKRRLVCEVNQILSFQCGLIALSEGRAYISINSKRMKVLGVERGSEVNIILTEDSSEFGVEVCAEIEELFKQDAEAKQRFDELAPGMQRYILNYVVTVKSSQLRIDRAFTLLSNLKDLPKGKISFKQLLGK